MSWAVRPNDEPSGFRGRKELLNRASALVTTCPYVCQLTSENIKHQLNHHRLELTRLISLMVSVDA